MTVKAEDIVDEKTLLAWLETRSAADAQVLAMRVSIRVSPLLLELFDRVKIGQDLYKLILFNFAVNFTTMKKCWLDETSTMLGGMSTTFLAEQLNDATRQVQYFYSDGIIGAAYSSVYSSDPPVTKESAVRAVRVTIQAISGAISLVPSEIWNSVRADASYLEDNLTLSSAPLWFNRARGFRSKVILSPHIRDRLNNARKRPEFSADRHRGKWGLLLDWYESLLLDPVQSLFGEEKDIELASQKDEFWEGDPDEVMERVAALVGWPHLVNKPASLMPAWQDGMLVQSAPPASTDIQKEIAVAALVAVRDEMRSLADKLKNEGNIDGRAGDFLQETADMILDEYPDIPVLFRLISREGVFHDYLVTVKKEWPELSASQYSTIATQLSLALDRFEERREFEKDIIEKEIGANDFEQITEFVNEAELALRNTVLEGVVDPSIPDALHKTTIQLPDPNSQSVPVNITERSSSVVAVDQIESLSNIGKQMMANTNEAELIRMVLQGNVEFAAGFKEDYVAASRKAGKEYARKTARMINPAVLSAAAGNAIFAKMKEKFPKTFGWWKD